MHNSQNNKTLQIVLIVLVAVLSLGIGYATISNINLIIDGNATSTPNNNNFKVHFVKTADTPNLTGNVDLTGSADIDKDDNTLASFSVGGLLKEGDYAIATYTIINNSNDVGAKLSLELTNSNADYFKVTETITDTELQAGDTTTGIVKVEMIKTPIDTSVTTSITAKIKATAVENDSAIGGSPASKVSDDPVSFSTDSWATIQKAVRNNNTDMYHVGDKKTVIIGGVEHTVRISNKSFSSFCGENAYSDTACGFVVEFTDSIGNSAMYGDSYDNSSNSIYYSETLVFSYLDSFYSQLPNDLKNVIADTQIYQDYNIIKAKLYLLSAKEVFDYDKSFEENASKQLDYYKEKGVYVSSDNPIQVVNNHYAVKEGEDSENYWWLRSKYIYDNKSFYQVSDGGFLNKISSYYNDSISPAFRIV